MAATKKTVVSAPKTPSLTKSAPRKAEIKSSGIKAKPTKESSADDLIAKNFTEMAKISESLGATLELLVQKVESMAYHIIATEETLAEIVAANGLNLARVNARIRAKIAAGTDNRGNANQAIDIAASIASPLPRR